MVTDIQFRDKFIGFVDILGFSDMVRAAEAGGGMSVPELLEMTKLLGTERDKEKFIKYGPTTCPGSRYIQKNLDFQITQISDCSIISAEVSPAGVINLVSHCWASVLELMTKGIMCRGYIKRGNIYHTKDQVIGSGYIDAYERERQVSAFKKDADERGTPFVEIDPEVVEYVAKNTDECVKKMFSRSVETDGSLTVLFPFKALAHSFIIAGQGVTFDPEKERTSNRNLRKWLTDFKANVQKLVDLDNSDAMRKSQHYLRALDVQLAKCDETDAFIDRWAALGPKVIDATGPTIVRSKFSK